MSMLQRVRVKKPSVRKELMEVEEYLLKVTLANLDKGDTDLKWYFNELDTYYQYQCQREGQGEKYLKPLMDQKDVLVKEYNGLKDGNKKEALKKKIEEQDYLLRRVEYLLRDSKREMRGMDQIYLVYENEALELKVLKDIYYLKEKKIHELKNPKSAKKCI